MTTCPICEMEYCKEDFLSSYIHDQSCNCFVRVVTRPGYFYFKRKEQDQMLVLAQRLFRNDRRPFALYHAFHLIVKADFSYSYSKSGFSYYHPDFNTYAALRLNQPSMQSRFRKHPEIMDELIGLYGLRDGMKDTDIVFPLPKESHGVQSYPGPLTAGAFKHSNGDEQDTHT